MDRRLKIITIALSLIYLISIGGGIYDGMADFIQGFNKGYEVGQQSVETGDLKLLSDSGLFFLTIKPVKGLRTFPTVMYNQLDGKPMLAEFEKIVVSMADTTALLPKGAVLVDIFSMLLALVALLVMVFVPVQTFQIVYSVTKNKIFDPVNIKRLRRIGYALLVFYIINLIFNYLRYFITSYIILLEGYKLQMDWGDITLALLGLVVLMFAEVLKVSVTIKEEQDLTV